jgi:hypothetical protein
MSAGRWQVAISSKARGRLAKNKITDEPAKVFFVHCPVGLEESRTSGRRNFGERFANR